MDYSFLGSEVPVVDIDRQLRLLWEQDQASTKASLMNFTIYSEAGDSLKRNSEAVGEITRHHACRAILMDLNRQGKNPSVRSWITAHCNLSGGKKSICCEQIAFQADGYAPGIVRHTLFSHMDSDLPMVLWWQGDFSESFRESFYSCVDRLLFDSGEWLDPMVQFAKLTEALEDVKSLVVQDLAWTRTYQFRLSVAALADHPAVFERLHQVSSIKIIANPRCRTSALQFLAWFYTLSGFRSSAEAVPSEGDVFNVMSSSGEPVRMSVELDPSHISLGGLEIEMGEVKVELERERDRQLLNQKIYLRGEQIMAVHCPADSDDAVGLITSQLSRGGKNSLFKKILPTFLQLL